MVAVSGSFSPGPGTVQGGSRALSGPADSCTAAATSPGEKAEEGQEEGHPQEEGKKDRRDQSRQVFISCALIVGLRVSTCLLGWYFNPKLLLFKLSKALNVNCVCVCFPGVDKPGEAQTSSLSFQHLHVGAL